MVGGGIAACATAIALARTGVRTGLSYSVTTRPRLAVGETVPPDVRKLLGELGAWEKFLEQRHEACLGSCSAWGGTELGHNDFVLNPQGSGWHLDRARFEALLLGEAESRGVALFPIAKCASLEQAADGGIVLGAITPSGDGRHLTARYIVDATGSRSVIARQMGARQIPLDRLSFVYGFFDAPEAPLPRNLLCSKRRSSAGGTRRGCPIAGSPSPLPRTPRSFGTIILRTRASGSLFSARRAMWRRRSKDIG